MRGELEVTLLATSLYTAIDSRNIRQVTKILHESNVDPNAIIPSKGISSFHLASGCENDIFAEEVTKLLLQFGGHPNIRSLDGMTPVHISAAWGRTNLLHLLLLNGGDPWLVDDEGNDAFDYAYQGNHINAIELLNRYIKFETRYSDQSDITPKFKMTLDKVLLYNSNAVVVYKTNNQYAPTQSHQLKCATTQTSPRENLLPSHDIDVDTSSSKHNSDNKCMLEDEQKKFSFVIADLKDHNVTLRRKKPMKHCKSNFLGEKQVSSQSQKETEFNLPGKSMCYGLQEQLVESEGNSKNNQSCEDKKNSRSQKCAIENWWFNSVTKTGMSSSNPEMTFMDELKKQQAKLLCKDMKSASSSESDFNRESDTMQRRVKKYHAKENDTNENFVQESRAEQGDGLKHVHSHKSEYSNWLEELKARQAAGLKENLKQISQEFSKTQLVTNEVMVCVNPSAAEHEIVSDISLVEINETVSDKEPECSITVNHLPETNQTVDSSIQKDDGKEYESLPQTKDNPNNLILLPLHDDQYKSRISFDKLYGFTVQDSDTLCTYTFSESEVIIHSLSENTMSILANCSLESDSASLQSGELNGLKSNLLPVDGSTVLTDIDTGPVSSTETLIVIPEKYSTKELEVVPKNAYLIGTVQITEVTDVSEHEDQRKVEEQKSDCACSLHAPQQNDISLNSMASSPYSFNITKETKHLELYRPTEPQNSASVLKPMDQNRKDITDVHTEHVSSFQSNSEQTSKYNIEENVQQIDNIQSSDETFHCQFENLFHNVSTSTRKHFLDLDDWMTMDWMDHVGPLNISELIFDEEIKCESSSNVIVHPRSSCDQDDIPSKDADRSLRSSPEYFTCNEEVQTLARHPSGKPNISKILFPGNTTVTSLPNLLKENCNPCLSTSEPIIQSKLRDSKFHFETKLREKISLQSAETTNFKDVTASSLSDTDSFVSVSEDYIYTDEEEGVVLLERRYLVPESCRSNSEGGTSGSSSTADSGSYDTDSLRSELKRRGLNPGPIIPSTKKVYVKKLRRLARNPEKLPKKYRVYSSELEKTLRKEDWYLDLSEYESLERLMAMQFADLDKTRVWRQGVVKSSFCYLLLDPRVTCNLPCRTENTPRSQIWSTFLEGIFYIGKGKRSRPYSHLYQAVSVWKTGETSSDPKIQRILDIWKDGVGVVCLHVFQNTIPVEAFSREAAMIDAMMLHNLKNSRRSEYYGLAATWTSHNKKMLGVYLLYKAMMIFLHEGERQLQPTDIGH